jgi:hypothetical protein
VEVHRALEGQAARRGAPHQVVEDLEGGEAEEDEREDDARAGLALLDGSRGTGRAACVMLGS